MEDALGNTKTVSLPKHAKRTNLEKHSGVEDKGKPLLDRSGEHEVGDSEASVTPPEWLDWDKFNQGRLFLKNHFCGTFLAMFVSVVSGLSIKSLIKPLKFTKNSDTPKKALQRYLRTFQSLTKWHYGNVWNSPDGEAHQSIMSVRNMHKSVRRSMNSGYPNGKKRLYLSQFDMAVVQYGFFGLVVQYPMKFGLRVTERELDDYVYFWRGLGYLLGISDQYNVCSGGYNKTLKVCREIEKDVFIPALQNPAKDFLKMANAITGGGNLVFRVNLFSAETVTAFVHSVLGIPAPSLMLLDKIRLLIFNFFISLLWYFPFLEKFFNKIFEMLLGCDKIEFDDHDIIF